MVPPLADGERDPDKDLIAVVDYSDAGVCVVEPAVAGPVDVAAVIVGVVVAVSSFSS